MPAQEKCPLCGCAFDALAQGCRPACPMASGCGLVCCPRCGYGFPQEHRGLAGMLKKALVRLAAPPKADSGYAVAAGCREDGKPLSRRNP